MMMVSYGLGWRGMIVNVGGPFIKIIGRSIQSQIRIKSEKRSKKLYKSVF
jgi:hypothetical protein